MVDYDMTVQVAGDVIQSTIDTSQGASHVLELGSSGYRIVIAEGGDFVFDLLGMCDGTRSLESVRVELKKRWTMGEAFQDTELENVLESLLNWHIIEAVSERSHE